MGNIIRWTSPILIKGTKNLTIENARRILIRCNGTSAFPLWVGLGQDANPNFQIDPSDSIELDCDSGDVLDKHEFRLAFSVDDPNNSAIILIAQIGAENKPC
jgi:hypothetical protein